MYLSSHVVCRVVIQSAVPAARRAPARAQQQDSALCVQWDTRAIPPV